MCVCELALLILDIYCVVRVFCVLAYFSITKTLLLLLLLVVMILMLMVVVVKWCFLKNSLIFPLTKSQSWLQMINLLSPLKNRFFAVCCKLLKYELTCLGMWDHPSGAWELTQDIWVPSSR